MSEAEQLKTQSVVIRQAVSAKDIETIAEAFRAYTEWLDEDLTHQDYATELSGLPGKYASPSGALLLAVDSDSDQPLGCIALRPLYLDHGNTSPNQRVPSCEIKRLFVYPEARGRQVARSLVREVLRRAAEQGYRRVYLDSLSRMTAAIALYKSEGFVEVAPYNTSPLDGTVYYLKEIASLT